MTVVSKTGVPDRSGALTRLLFTNVPWLLPKSNTNASPPLRNCKTGRHPQPPGSLQGERKPWPPHQLLGLRAVCAQTVLLFTFDFSYHFLTPGFFLTLSPGFLCFFRLAFSYVIDWFPLFFSHCLVCSNSMGGKFRPPQKKKSPKMSFQPLRKFRNS